MLGGECEWSEMLIVVTCTINSQHSEHSNQVENSIQRNTDAHAERKPSAQQLKLNPEKISTWYHCWRLASAPLTNWCSVENIIPRVKDFRQNNCMDKNKWWKWNGRMPLQRTLPEPNRNPHSDNCETRYVRTWATQTGRMHCSSNSLFSSLIYNVLLLFDIFSDSVSFHSCRRRKCW